MKKTIHSIKLASLDGGSIDFEASAGKKILIVNVASQCGFTKQYKQLQELHEHFGQKLDIIGCPCNDFGKQEPGSPEEIQAFCDLNYKVTFPLSEKVKIKGKQAHPLYNFLTKEAENGVRDTEVAWNFHKFLLDKEGQLIKDFPSSVDPLSEEILAHLMD